MRIAALAMALVLATGTAQAAGVLRVGLQDDPDQLDPVQGGTFAGRIVFAAMCDKLVDLDANLQFVPQLATSWTWSNDGRALTLTLREGVTFQDGESMDATAVAANLERARNAPESNRKAELRPVGTIDVVDPRTVRLVLTQPFAPLISILSDRAGMVASPKAFKALGKDFARTPICSGPFRLVERVAQDRMVLDRHPGYWDAARVHFDRVVFRPIADSSVRLLNLQAGQLDIIEEVAATDAAKLRVDPRLTLTTTPGLGYMALGFNMAHGSRAENPFARDARLRAALEAALDRDVINRVVMDGLATPNNQSELPSSPFHNTGLPLPPRDVPHARALLREAGVDHPVLDLMVSNTPRDKQMGEVIQAMAAEAGIEVRVAAGEVNSNIAAMNRGDYQAHLNVWSGRADPDPNLSVYLAPDSFQNWGHYGSTRFATLLARGRMETEPAARRAVYREIAAVLAEERPMIFLVNLPWIFGHSAKLQGFVPTPDGLIRVQDMR